MPPWVQVNLGEGMWRTVGGALKWIGDALCNWHTWLVLILVFTLGGLALHGYWVCQEIIAERQRHDATRDEYEQFLQETAEEFATALDRNTAAIERDIASRATVAATEALLTLEVRSARTAFLAIRDQLERFFEWLETENRRRRVQ